jgi:alkanesulfonate monooxygenase SsuD/methylene tetrahydromethanopterin reductase-like flavin-dependent oxidoreductase (luciferase family)
MRVGVFLPNAGPSANPEAVVAGARQAEQLGYDSVWVLDRLLYPVKPRNPYPASGAGAPSFARRAYRPGMVGRRVRGGSLPATVPGAGHAESRERTLTNVPLYDLIGTRARSVRT